MFVSDISTVSSDDLSDRLIFPACSGSLLCPLSCFKPFFAGTGTFMAQLEHGHMVKLFIEPALYNISLLSNLNYFPIFLLSCNVPSAAISTSLNLSPRQYVKFLGFRRIKLLAF